MKEVVALKKVGRKVLAKHVATRRFSGKWNKGRGGPYPWRKA